MIALFGVLAKLRRSSVIRDINVTVRLQCEIEGGQGGHESGTWSNLMMLRIDLPKVKS
jgi:hypothetical protein